MQVLAAVVHVDHHAIEVVNMALVIVSLNVHVRVGLIENHILVFEVIGGLWAPIAPARRQSEKIRLTGNPVSSIGTLY